MKVLHRLHPSRWRRSAPRPPDDEDEVGLHLPPPEPAQTLEQKVSEIYERFVTRSTAEINGMLEMLGSRRRLLWVNFLAGMSRGVGFFLGVTLIGGLIIGGTAFILDKTAETVGLKDVTFASMVKAVYSKFQEVRAVIDEIEGTRPPERGTDDVASGGGPRQAPVGLTGIGAYRRRVAAESRPEAAPGTAQPTGASAAGPAHEPDDADAETAAPSPGPEEPPPGSTAPR